jgi:hypothetical protein
MSVPFQAPAAFNPRQPFSRAEARAAGLTAEMLLSRRFHKIFWDTYVAREVLITPLQRAKAVIRLVPSGSYISHHTAAELWGAAAPADGATHVTCRRPVGAWFARGLVRTTATTRRKPRFARVCRSRLQSRPSSTWRQSASGLLTWSSWPTA